MPNITMTLREVSQSVSRPIIFDAVSKVKAITGIPEETPVYYPGDSGRMKQEGSFLGSDDRIPKLASNDILFIEVEETTNQDWINKTSVNRPDTPAVFLDKKLNTYLCTVYSMTDIVINVRFRTRSGTNARNWVDDARRRIASTQQLFVHSFNYHYGIPDPLLELINVIHHCREEFEGYGDTFKEYLEKHTDGRLTIISDIAGKSQIYVVSERQSRIIGSFSFDPLPEKPEYDQSTGTYTVSFSYKFTYERPMCMTMKYPIVVHNQLLPPEYVLPVSSNDEDIGFRRMYSGSDIGLSKFEASSTTLGIGDGVIRIPSHDEFNGTIKIFGYSPVLSILCTKEIEDRKKLFNLRDLGDYEIDRTILDFILSTETLYITKKRDSVFYLLLLNNETPVSDDSLVVRSNGDVLSREIIPLRDVTRVCLYVNTDTDIVKQTALDRFRKNKPIVEKILTVMNEAVSARYGRENTTGKDYYTETDLLPEYRNQILTQRRHSPSGYGIESIAGIPANITGKDLLALRYGLFRRKTVGIVGIGE